VFWQTSALLADKIEEFVRRRLREFRGRVEDPDAVYGLHASLVGLHRTGQAASVEVVCKWAQEEGWARDQVLALRGIALVAAHATADLGELTTTRAADERLVVHLTEDETRLARAAVSSILSGPYAIPEWEFDTMTGFRTDEARALLDATGRAIGQRIGERRDGLRCVAEFRPPDASGQARDWKAKYGDLLGPTDDWVIDIPRPQDGEVARIWIPETREPKWPQRRPD
jgi:hypothetical protein